MSQPTSRLHDQPVEVLDAEPADVLEVVEPIPTAEFADEPRRPIRRLIGVVGSAAQWLFGLAALMVGLAVLAAIPILNLLSLGYLLESAGRVARGGRLRDGFIGVRLAARLGGIVAGSWLMLIPVMVVSDLAKSAQIINPGSRAAGVWRGGLLVLIGLTFIHIAAAVARGGKLRYFFWPFNVVWLARRVLRGGYYTEARDAVWDTVMSLRLPHYFWLGLRGAAAVLAWIALPVTLLVVSNKVHSDGASFLGVVGALMLAVILPYLPFLQLRLAQTNRFRGAFEVGAVRAAFRRAPWAFAVAFVVTLLFALPLYLLKILLLPRELLWLPCLIFMLFIYPARLLTGWALGRANRRAAPRHWFFRWTGRLPLLPAAAFYVLIVFFTQYTSWDGVWDLYAQHAFLVPVPFLGL